MPEKLNQGVGPCTTDLYKIQFSESVGTNKATAGRMQNNSRILFTGRKNFAITECKGIIQITGGMNQYGAVQTDMLVYQTKEALWKDFKLKLNSENPVRRKVVKALRDTAQ